MSDPAASVQGSQNSGDNTSLLLNSNPVPGGRRRGVTRAEKGPTVQSAPKRRTSASNSTSSGSQLQPILKAKQPAPRKPREPSRLKKSLTVFRAMPRSKAADLETPPWWRTARAAVINALMLALLVALLRSILGLDGSILASNMDAQYLEVRISEVEASLKETARATQLKIDGLVERAKHVEEKGVLLGEEMKAHAAKTDDMETYLISLMDKKLLTQDEFQVLSRQFLKKSESPEEGGRPGLSMDDVMNYAREVIIKEIEKHAADGIGMIDYALASSGARVVRHSKPYVSCKASAWFSVGMVHQTAPHEHAQRMLQPSHGEPGQCFALNGSRGFVEVKLRKEIIPDAVTLEHVAESVAYDRSSAPKDCLLSGWFEGPEGVSSRGGEKRLPLKEFSYDLGKGSVQTFHIETTAQGFVNMIRLEILSNHGSSSHTCIYRLRVHGYDPGSIM